MIQVINSEIQQHSKKKQVTLASHLGIEVMIFIYGHMTEQGCVNIGGSQILKSASVPLLPRELLCGT